MSTTEVELSKPATTEQQPKAPKSGELDEKQLDEVSGGSSGTTSTLTYKAPPPPPPRAP
jgi:hypothetical protein